MKDVEVQRKVSKVSLLFSLLVLPAMPVVFLRAWELNLLGATYLVPLIFVGKWILRGPGETVVAEVTFLERLVGERSTTLIAAQTISSALVMVMAADVFLDSVLLTGDPLTYGLLVSPFATCLEEVAVASVWTLRSKASMGLALLSGENVVHSTLEIGLVLLAIGATLPVVTIWFVLLYSAFADLYSAILQFSPNRLLLPGPLGYAAYFAETFYLL